MLGMFAALIRYNVIICTYMYIHTTYFVSLRCIMHLFFISFFFQTAGLKFEHRFWFQLPSHPTRPFLKYILCTSETETMRTIFISSFVYSEPFSFSKVSSYSSFLFTVNKNMIPLKIIRCSGTPIKFHLLA